MCEIRRVLGFSAHPTGYGLRALTYAYKELTHLTNTVVVITSLACTDVCAGDAIDEIDIPSAEIFTRDRRRRPVD